MKFKFRQSKPTVWMSAGALILGSWTVWAQNPKTAPTAKTATASRTGNINIRNHPTLGRASSDLANGIQRLTKDVVVTQDGEDFIMYADELTYFENDNVATARVKLHVDSPDSTLIGDVARADFDAKIITFTGNVVMRSYGSKDGIKTKSGSKLRNEVLHKPSSITCDRLDYDYENREAKLSGNIRMRQGENFGTCEQVIFDEANNIARLMGRVEFTNGDRQTIRTRDLTIWIDDNKIETERSTGITIPRKSEPSKATRTPRPRTQFKPAPKLPDSILNDPARKAVPTPLPPRELPDEEEATSPAPTAAPDETTPATEPKSDTKPVVTPVVESKE